MNAEQTDEATPPPRRRAGAEGVEQANASGTTPVVFIHGLWLLPSSWDRWAAVFEEAGYAALDARAGRTIPRPSTRPTPTRRCSRDKTVGQVADHYERRHRRRSPRSRPSSATRSAAC